MAKNIEEITRRGKKYLKDRLNYIEESLKLLSIDKEDKSAIRDLKVQNTIYVAITEMIKDWVEFRNLQEEYNKLLPKIKEYIEVKTN